MNNQTDEQRIKLADERYRAAAHAVQSGVLAEMRLSGLSPTGVNAATGPKHLRTGLDMRAADHEGLVRLLLDKGVFTLVEYLEAMADAAEREKTRYEQRLGVHLA